MKCFKPYLSHCGRGETLHSGLLLHHTYGYEGWKHDFKEFQSHHTPPLEVNAYRMVGKHK